VDVDGARTLLISDTGCIIDSTFDGGVSDKHLSETNPRSLAVGFAQGHLE
jgi:hypothetical protein